MFYIFYIFLKNYIFDLSELYNSDIYSINIIKIFFYVNTFFYSLSSYILISPILNNIKWFDNIKTKISPYLIYIIIAVVIFIIFGLPIYFYIINKIKENSDSGGGDSKSWLIVLIVVVLLSLLSIIIYFSKK